MVNAAPQKQPTFAQKESVKSLGEVEVDWDAKTGAPASIRGKDLAAINLGGRGMAPGRKGDFAVDAVAVMDRLTKAFSLQNASEEFSVLKSEADQLGFHHVRLNQTWQGLRVVGGQLIVHFDSSGKAYEVNGRYVPGIAVETDPVIDEISAVTVAQNDLLQMGKPAGSLAGHVETVIYARDVSPLLAYEFMLSYDDSDAGVGRWRYWVDAVSGGIINRFNDVKKFDATITGSILTGEGGQTVTVTGDCISNTVQTNFWMYNTNRQWYVYNTATISYEDTNSIAHRNFSNDWSSSDLTEMSAAYNFNNIQLYYSNVFGRASYDNTNAMACVAVHYLNGSDNAFWTGVYFLFYRGNNYAELTVLDICGHEFTHAVDQYSANLTYQDEPGALNESFSDIFGAAIEFTYQPDGRSYYPGRRAGYADWLLAEDCTYPYQTAMRDMRDPQRYSQPSKYHGTEWYYGSLDDGGVHYNSGVQNHFYYLLSEGGSGANDGISYNVTGIGVSNATRIAYRALTVYCTANTDYSAVRRAWISAAQDLDTNWVNCVQTAWSAVGVNAFLSPTSVNASQATYTDRIRLSWSTVTGASGYSIYRGTTASFSGASLLASTTAISYDDTSVSAGVVYYYWIRATGTNGSINDVGDFSAMFYGSAALSAPASLFAGQGTSADYVRITWNSASGAGGYIVYRGSGTNSGAASELARVSSSPYDDSSATPGSTYYYWVKSYSVVSTSSLSSRAGGYRGLPAPGGVTASQGTYSSGVRVAWNGVSGAISYRIWRSASSDSSSAVNVGETSETAFTDTSATPGVTYYYWVQSKKWSLVGSLSGSAQGWRYSMAAGNDARGDFDGDGVMDFAVYQEATGMWYIRLSGSSYATIAYQLGGPGFSPVACDYDGDGKTDPAIYQRDNGLWAALLSGSGNALVYAVLGGYTFDPVPGDYDGDGRADAAVFQEASGTWQVLLSKQNYAFLSTVFGGPGNKPVPSDYDGDGKLDPAFYFEVSGLNLGYWYMALSGSGYVFSYRTTTGTGYVPVPADYDGDGLADLAVYNSANGLWNYWSSASNSSLPIVFTLGGAGYAAVPADYDGDAKADIAVYQEAAGIWYFLLSSRNYSSATGELGGPGFEAVAARQ